MSTWRKSRSGIVGMGHKYKASWGQVVEFYTVGKRLLYAYATIPGGNIQDIRAIAIQEKVGEEATVEQIYDSLKMLAPQTSHETIFVHKGAPPAEQGQRQRWFGRRSGSMWRRRKSPVPLWTGLLNYFGEGCRGTGAAVAACRLEAPSCIHRHVLSRWRYSPTAFQLQVVVAFGCSLLL